MEEIKQRIDDLRRQINSHNHSYYVDNNPTISDYDYDMMVKELERLEKEYPQFDDELSPTHRVGSDITRGFVQHKHIYPMLSLGNTYSVEEVDAWVNRTTTADTQGERELVGELKFDGSGISLIYRNGRLERAVTRGDGEKGDVVTENIKTIKSIPLQLSGSDWSDFFEIRGEIVLPYASFERINQERAFNEEPLFANPRNAAAGTVKLLNPAEVARRGLDAYFYYLLGENLPYDNHYDNMMAAKSWGFKVSDAMTRLQTREDVDAFISKWDTERRSLPVATDGLVFKINALRRQVSLGFTAKTPRWAVAYKFAAERALTRLKFISYDVGRTGVITPVANLEPVLLSGTIVKRASLHNEDIVRSLGICDNDMLYVEKGGEIIPKITGVDESARTEGVQPVKFVTHCPACGTPLTRLEGESAWICSNKYGCPPQIVGRIEHFVARRMMNVDGIGEETVQALYDRRLLNNYADLYSLTVSDFAQLDGFGQRSAERAIAGLEQSKSVPFERVVFALSIPNVGETTAKKIARKAGSIDKLMSMTEEELIAIDDVGPTIAASVVEFFSLPINRLTIERLKVAGLTMEIPESERSETSSVLQGKVFVISGVFASHSRDEYKAMIEQYGGKNVGSVSRKTDFLLAGDNPGPTKVDKANSLNVPIINEEKFLEMIAKNSDELLHN